jgi:hypothetical protein
MTLLAVYEAIQHGPHDEAAFDEWKHLDQLKMHVKHTAGYWTTLMSSEDQQVLQSRGVTSEIAK